MAQKRSGFSSGSRPPHLPVGGDDLHGAEVVAGQAVGPHHQPHAAPQGEPGDPGGGHLATRRGQAEGLGGSVQLSPRDPSLGPGGPGLGIHGDSLHGGEIDDEPVIAEGATGHLVPAAPDAHGRPEVPGHPNGRHHVLRAAAAGHGGGAPVHEPVPDLTSLVVAGMSGVDDFSPKGLISGPSRGRWGWSCGGWVGWLDMADLLPWWTDSTELPWRGTEPPSWGQGLKARDVGLESTLLRLERSACPTLDQMREREGPADRPSRRSPGKPVERRI
jgi:hypothetical protein